jgi:hypothetical protein
MRNGRELYLMRIENIDWKQPRYPDSKNGQKQKVHSLGAGDIEGSSLSRCSPEFCLSPLLFPIFLRF